MKNKLLGSLTLVSLLVAPLISLAYSYGVEDSAQSPEQNNRETIKQNIEAKKESIKNSIEERRENALSKIEERVNKFLQHINERFDTAIERLENLARRIDSRIAKLEAEKIDVSKSKEMMLAAKAKIEVAKISVSNLPLTLVGSTTSSTTTASIKADFKSIRTKIEKAKNDIKAAHAALIDVVKNLKPGQLKLEMKLKTKGEHATTTASTTVETNN